MNLPSDYIRSMQELLGDEYSEYINCFEQPRHYGLRVNITKISVEQFLKISPFSLTKIPFISNGFYYDEAEAPAKHPYYYAGLYYLQEPSAMLPAELLPIEAGYRVLDLCAAPGGKATELGAKLNGTGILYANDISASRAKSLLKNLEMHGIANCYVTAEEPKKLATHFTEYFDKILVDAPCSGEGMFRKEPALIKSYEEKGPAYYAALQKEIVTEAVKMLRPGGMLLYSTCTFSKLEDEDTIQYILDTFSDMKLCKPVKKDGFCDGIAPLNDCIRIYPHKLKGEGHFIALLQKDSGTGSVSDTELQNAKEISKTQKTVQLINLQSSQYRLLTDTQVYKDLRYLRTGLLLGEFDKIGVLQPSQAYAMSLKASEYDDVLNLSVEDIRVVKYLKGESIELSKVECDAFKNNAKKSILVCVDGYSLGFGKANGHLLKNKYTPAWRMQS